VISGTVLVIDNNAARARRVNELLRFLGCEDCATLEADGALASDWQPGAVAMCVVGDCGDAPAQAGMVRALRARDPHLPVFLHGGAPANGALDAFVLGQLPDPLTFESLSDALARARAMRARDPAPRARPPERFRALVGNSRAIAAVREAIAAVAPAETPVLVLGEPGTGREIAARNLHYQSARRDGPFVAFNCGAVPPAALDEELFGPAGCFARARGGTLFLDGLDGGADGFRSVLSRLPGWDGAGQRAGVDVRLVVASSTGSESEVTQDGEHSPRDRRQGPFTLRMPSLRERVEDIPLLIHELVTRMEHSGAGSVRFTPLAIVALCGCPWPGNVRELAGLVQQMVSLHPGRVVDLPELPERFRGPVSRGEVPEGLAGIADDSWRSEPRLPRDGLDLRAHIHQLEQELIQQAMEQVNGVVTHAARLLRMRRTTLIERLRKHGRGGAMH